MSMGILDPFALGVVFRASTCTRMDQYSSSFVACAPVGARGKRGGVAAVSVGDAAEYKNIGSLSLLIMKDHGMVESKYFKVVHCVFVSVYASIQNS